MTNFEDKLKEASVKAAKVITADLRSNLVSSGWPAEVASAVTVVYEQEDFGVEISGPNKDQANALEYGTETRRPTASIRKYFNRSGPVQELYLSVAEEYLGEFV